MLSSCSVISAALILVGYLVTYIARNGLPSSISETYYHVGSRWVFSAVLAAVGLLLLPVWITAGRLEFCAFLSCVSVLFVAASPQFRDAWVSRIHYGAAVVMGASSLAWLVFNGASLYAVSAAFVLAIIDAKHWMWWVEVGIFVNVIIALL